MKQIKIDDDVWDKLWRLKLNLKSKSLNNVISSLQKLVKKLSLMKDLEILVESEVKVRKERK